MVTNTHEVAEKTCIISFCNLTNEKFGTNRESFLAKDIFHVEVFALILLKFPHN